jgi:hypothetical protein
VPARAREELLYGLEILALTAFAFAQPLLDVFGRSPETFVFRGADSQDIVVFALVVCLVPPAVIIAVAALANAFGREARRWAQTVVVAVLFGVLLMVVGKKATGLRHGGLVSFAVFGAVAAGVLYRRAAPVRSWLRYASVAPAIFALLFLFSSSVSELLSVGSGASAAVDVDRNVPVIVLVLDEFPTSSLMRPDGTLDAELFPGFADLASNATWYRNASTVALRTFYAVPAILTGREPHDEVVPVASAYPANLFTLLGQSYEVHSGEAITRLCPATICRATDRDALGPLFEQAEDVWKQISSPSSITSDPNETLIEEPARGRPTPSSKRDPRFDYRGNSTTPARFEEFLSHIGDGSTGSLHLLHLVLPHGPYQYYPSGRQYDDDGAPRGRGRGPNDDWTSDEGVVRLGRQRHVLQSQYVDALVQRLLDRLREQRIYDDSLVVVTADHGVAFEPGLSSRGGAKDAVQPSWPDMAFVPFFVKAPGQQTGSVSDDNVYTIDVVPTIADAVGIDLPWHVDGRSLLSQAEPRDPDRKFLYTSNAATGAEAPGTRYRIDADEGERYVREHGIGALAPPGDPRWRLYRIGPYPELVGLPVAALARAQDPIGPVELGKPERFQQAAPSEGRVPGIVYGDLRDGLEPSAPVVVAINGTVAGVSPRFTTGTRSEFGVMPPDWLWVDGANEVTCYLVRGRDGGIELVPLRADET